MRAARLLRVTLAAAFLSAVADRFGLWGPPGAPGVAWGNFEAFIGYTARLNFFAPSALIPLLAWTATSAEVALAMLLLAGYRLREAAIASGLLLAAFAVTMTLALGVKAPLDYSVFTAAAAAFALAALEGSHAAEIAGREQPVEREVQ